MHSLEIYLLGPLRIVTRGVPVEDHHWPRRKPKLLIELLALSPHHQLHREQVMESLWPELEPESATNSLHKTIHMARRVLEPHLTSGARSRFILTERQQVILSAPGGLWIDVDAFEEQATAALKGTESEAYKAALALYRGDLLIEDLYEDWAAVRRERLRALQRELLSKLAKLYEELAQYDLSIARLKEITDLDAADEESQRRLIRLYAFTGDKFRALEQYKQCREALRRELDAEPERATVELGKQILIGRIQSLASEESLLLAPPSLRQITFRRGWIQGARFAAGGQTILYSAAWDGNALELFATDHRHADPRALGITSAGLFAVSSTGEMALSLRRRFLRGYVSRGTLARASVDGNVPNEILDGVQWVDWSSDGKQFAVVRDVKGRNCLEFPIGHVLYETGGWISHPRISPRGDRIAFLDHPIPADDSGRVAVPRESFHGRRRRRKAPAVIASRCEWSMISALTASNPSTSMSGR